MGYPLSSNGQLSIETSNVSFFSYRFRPNQFSVRVGEWDLSDNDNYVQEFRVVDIQAHPDFKPNGFYNDVALFILDQPVKFTE